MEPAVHSGFDPAPAAATGANKGRKPEPWETLLAGGIGIALAGGMGLLVMAIIFLML